MSAVKTGDEISVYVANLGRYNEGESVGGKIDLPVSKEELKAFLENTVGVETDPQKAEEKAARGERVYEEYAIHDFEYEGALAKLGFEPGEHESLETLNDLAQIVSGFFDQQFDAVHAAFAEDGHAFASPALALANLAVQVDEIPFYEYEFAADGWSPQEKLGRALTPSSLQEELEKSGLTHRFDYEGHGRDMEADAYTALENGYLDCSQRFPDAELYSAAEIAEFAEETRQADAPFHAEAKEKASEKPGFADKIGRASESSRIRDDEKSGGKSEKTAIRDGGGREDI